ncbi:MAG: hypothetical protein JSW73_01080 [Candidatus Woesearchaeota archaeon]|nr:MAG: hypothetical protein JSW73_01080 [Candidatus Woesearchaeota archaeon]
MITKLDLKNWKNHRSIELEFYPGINSIVGDMGSGKSSILQAISFALFGTFSELKSKEIKTTDLITRNVADSSKVFLEFKNSRDNLVIERKVHRDKTSEATLKRKGKLISGPQVQEVTASVEKIIGVNQNLWLRTVYAKQNEIDYFLNIPPLRRKKELDELMNLDKFEKARENSVKLINILKNRIKEKSSVLEDFDLETIEEKIHELSSSLKGLKEEASVIESKIKTAEKEKEKVKETLEEVKEKVNEINKITERYSLLKEELEELKEEIEEIEVKDRHEFEQELQLIKKSISDNQIKKQKLKEVADEKRELLIDLEKQLSVIKEKIKEIREDNERILKLKEDYSKYKEIGEEFSHLSKEIEDKKSLIDNRKGFLSNLKYHVEQLKKAESVCPVCSTRLDPQTKQRLIMLREQKIASEEREIQLMERALKELQGDEDTLKEKDEERKRIINQLKSYKETLGDKKELIEEFKKLDTDKSDLKESIEIGEGTISEIEKKLEELSEEYVDLQNERNLQEKIDRKNKLEKEIEEISCKKVNEKKVFDDLEKVEELYEKLIQKVQEIKTRKEYISPLIEERKARLEELSSSKEEIAKINKEIQKIKMQSEFLNKFKNSLIQAQGELRSELILAVNEIMGNIWQDIYPYEKWSGIRLEATEEDYILQLKEVDGDWLSIAGFASGGERMIASLALRIAFAKILAPKLDLLILDEPTHNLDKNTIDKLTQVIEDRLSNLLNQTFIVTHEEKLAESASNLIKIKE